MGLEQSQMEVGRATKESQMEEARATRAVPELLELLVQSQKFLELEQSHKVLEIEQSQKVLELEYSQKVLELEQSQMEVARATRVEQEQSYYKSARTPLKEVTGEEPGGGTSSRQCQSVDMGECRVHTVLCTV